MLGKMSFSMRKKLHNLVLLIYKIINRCSGFTYKILEDNHVATDKPIILAITHVGKYDIQVVNEAVKEHFYVLSGDYEHIQGTIDEYFLRVNGCIYFNEKVKSDRHEVLEKMISHLLQGGNLIYFPEGTWNLSENLPVLPCYWEMPIFQNIILNFIVSI